MKNFSSNNEDKINIKEENKEENKKQPNGLFFIFFFSVFHDQMAHQKL